MLTERLQHPLAAVAGAVLLTLPWLTVWLSGGPSAYGLSHVGTVGVSGLAVLGASFLLAWGAETAEKDVPRAFALAVLAVLAVAPEYAVDALYAWNAGAGGATSQACAALPPGFVEHVSQLPAAEINTAREELARGCHAANLAVANMTGANRILIGLGWSGIALYSIYRIQSEGDVAIVREDGLLADRVRLDPSIATEIFFLFVATVFAFFVPVGGGIGIVDMVFLVGLYASYIFLIVRGGVEEDEAHVGVPAYFQAFVRRHRVAVVLSLFAYSGLLIMTAVEPFAHGLEAVGIQMGIEPFLMIQWVAPLASESPELIVVAYLVNKARTTAGFNALISSKLNQWTLLIGTLVVVYSISYGQYGVLPFDEKQAGEIWLTAAQSLFALAILVNFTISAREALALLALFLAQLHPAFHHYEALLGFSALYIVLALALFARRSEDLQRLVRMVSVHASGERLEESERPHGGD
ncbi:MAG: sodium:calcium antiporter [Halobacterium sp.]